MVEFLIVGYPPFTSGTNEWGESRYWELIQGVEIFEVPAEESDPEWIPSMQNPSDSQTSYAIFRQVA